MGFPGGKPGKNSGSIPGLEDPLEKEVATHSSTLAWKIPWTEEHGRVQSTGSHRVRHDLTTKSLPPKGQSTNVSPASLPAFCISQQTLSSLASVQTRGKKY